ncbi:hypothetical protein C8D70_101367 [Chryseobacterium sp. CBTAP 102]|uniref:hypothetical protein n=1 Tax=Chryseobacterium sp. CBTAP 102 TaxID=2135644 RepID=UPI000D753972|nr:hypothetical protein [Chryseobacterium sp. CBTAP 102]PXW18041.1 hypothetical protein C8D70_101367 [Chryseobacterium sp. CBTAP 102]
MRSLDKILDIASNKIGFPILQKYLLNNGFKKIESRRTDLAVFFKEGSRPIEIIVPLKRDFIDYKDSIKSVLEKISIYENRNIEYIINDLIIPPSDIIRFRVVNEETENGLISFQDGFNLLENAKKSLYATACDIVSPSIYHKKLYSKQATQFIDSCYLGQTERGSFIASIVCPFINSSIEESAIQLSLFNDEEILETSLTRTITKKFIKSLHEIKSNIEVGNYDFLEEQINTDRISVNFLESIVELGEYGDKDKIDISISWSNHIEKINDLPNEVSFTKDYIQPLEYIITKYTPKDEGTKGTFVGKISEAKTNPDLEKRNFGEITFNFINEENKAIKAKLNLNPEQFSDALKAFDSGYHVKIEGELISHGRSHVINNPTFKIIE